MTGPFPLDTGALRLDRSNIGDPAALFAIAGDTVPGTHGMQWHAESADSMGRVDLYSVFRDPKLDDRAAYALTYIESPEARTVRLAVESDDDVVIWLNGRRVHRREIARELRSGADTITLTLASGANRLLYRVVNRGGGFGLGARLLDISRDPVGDLRSELSASAREGARRVIAEDRSRAAPARAAITLGPVTMGTRARLVPARASRSGDSVSNSRLVVELRVCATRWSSTRGGQSLAIGTSVVPLPTSRVREAVAVAVDADWAELARGALAGGAHAEVRRGLASSTRLALPIDAGALLALLSRPIEIESWIGGESRGGVPEVDVRALTDSVARQKLGRIHTTVVIPPALDGLSLDAEVAEFGAAASIRANDATLTPDSLGRARLCTPCRTGARIALSIAPHGRWWDPPRIRARDLGWTEIRDGAEWARYFAGDSTLVIRDSIDAMMLLRKALEPSKAAYHAQVATWLAQLAPAAARIRRDTIDIVGHSHIDAAWLWRVRDGRDVLQATWETATKLMAKYPDMHFAASSAQYYRWLEEQDPQALARIQTLVREHRWDPVGGWWVESDANLPSGESLVRQALYGQRTFIRMFGAPARVAWLPNSFGFSWSLPQILRKSGFEFFVTEEMRWNDTNRWPPGLNTFWWEGPDGSRIFTDIIYAYDHDLAPRRLAKEFVVTRDSSASPRMLTVYGVGDHGGGPTMQMLDRARDLQRIPTFPVVRDASPDSSLARMRLDAKAGPVLRDELYLEYHRGTYTTQAAVKRKNRELESLLSGAEAAATLAPLPYPSDSLRAAWERVLFNQFHDILPGTSIRGVYEDAASEYEHAESSARRILERSLVAIADSMDTRPSIAGETPYLVFNASGHPRTGIVRLPRASGSVARDARGRVLASGVDDSALLVQVTNVPAAGTQLIFVGRGPPPPSPRSSLAPSKNRVLESGAMRVEIDASTGNIARLFDKTHRREALSRGAGGLLLMDDVPAQWQAWNIDNLRGARSWIDQSVSVDSVVHTPIGSMVTVHRQRDSVRVTERYTLRGSPARLEIDMSIDWHGKDRLLKLAMPLAFHIDSTRAEIPYASIARPTRPATPHDSARFETPMQRWLDGSSGDFGVAIVNDSKYGYSASGDTMFVTLLRSPKFPDSLADIGMQHVTLSVVPHAGNWRAPAIREAATELNAPMMAVAVSAHAGPRANTGWLNITPSSIELGALKRGEDDDRILVRLIETTGRATIAHLRLAVPVIASETDLLEREMPAGFHARGTALSVPLGAFEIKTIAMKPLRPR